MEVGAFVLEAVKNLIVYAREGDLLRKVEVGVYGSFERCCTPPATRISFFQHTRLMIQNSHSQVQTNE